MIPTGANAVVVLLVFFVPGFVAEWVYERFAFCPAKSDFRRLLSSLTVSGVLWIVAGPFLYHDWLTHHSVVRFYLFALPVVIVGAPVLGYLFARFRLPTRRLFARLQSARGLRSLLRLSPLESHLTAWDAVFSDSCGRWVVVHTVDGQTHYGVYGKDSYAGFSPHAPDLYLEHLWFPDEKGGFMDGGERETGAYFPASQIARLEFPPRTMEAD